MDLALSLKDCLVHPVKVSVVLSVFIYPTYLDLDRLVLEQMKNFELHQYTIGEWDRVWGSGTYFRQRDCFSNRENG